MLTLATDKKLARIVSGPWSRYRERNQGRRHFKKREWNRNQESHH